MKDRKILILGGNGYIGKNLTKHFAKEGAKVTCFDYNVPVDPIENVTYIQGDFYQLDAVERALENQEMIVHALGKITPANSCEQYIEAYETEFMQSVKVCEKIAERKLGFVFLSSGGTVYGEQSEQPISEHALTVPQNHYGNMKLCMENVIRVFNHTHHTNMKIARISNPYGPGHLPERGIGFADTALECAISGNTLKVWGDGSIVRDYIYIEDVCKMIQALLLDQGEETVFNISSGIGISQLEVIRQIEKMGLSLKWQNAEKREMDLKKVILDNTKIKTIYSGKIHSFEEGMNQYYAFLKKEMEKS